MIILRYFWYRGLYIETLFYVHLHTYLILELKLPLLQQFGDHNSSVYPTSPGTDRPVNQQVYDWFITDEGLEKCPIKFNCFKLDINFTNKCADYRQIWLHSRYIFSTLFEKRIKNILLNRPKWKNFIQHLKSFKLSISEWL